MTSLSPAQGRQLAGIADARTVVDGSRWLSAPSANSRNRVEVPASPSSFFWLFSLRPTGRPTPSPISLGRRMSSPLAFLSTSPLSPMRPTVHLDLLVPLRDNDGVPFTDVDFERLEDYLLSLAGGFTRRADVEGVWRSPEGVVMRDRSRAYALTLPRKVADLQMSLLTVYIRKQFRQEAAFVEQIPTLASAF